MNVMFFYYLRVISDVLILYIHQISCSFAVLLAYNIFLGINVEMKYLFRKEATSAKFIASIIYTQRSISFYPPEPTIYC